MQRAKRVAGIPNPVPELDIEAGMVGNTLAKEGIDDGEEPKANPGLEKKTFLRLTTRKSLERMLWCCSSSKLGKVFGSD
jgi:hypothetical protein